MITHIEIVSLPVTDQDRALRFYRDVLGFFLLRDGTFPAGDREMRWFEMGLPAGQTKIALTTWFPEMPKVTGLVLFASDLERERQEIRSRGVDATEIVESPWGRWFSFADPDGNGWVIQETPQVKTDSAAE